MKDELSSKRDDILKATLELISTQGFHATPMSQIAKKAQLGAGTIYRYFNNKEDLLNELYIETKTKIIEAISDKYSEQQSIHDSFINLLRCAILFYIENPNYLLFTEQYENSPLITQSTHEKIEQLVVPILDIFSRGLEKNLIKNLNYEITGAIISGSVIAIAKLYINSSLDFNKDDFDGGLEAIWDAIKA
jgi:AcrR family transcriptional regulator